jgi:chromosome segregation ATPase
MYRISSQTEKRIVELWFEGLPRDVIARRLGVSGSTVSSVISSLPECLRELRDLSVELRKSNASPSEALKGAKLLSKLGELGIEPKQLGEFIQAAVKLSRKAEYQPEQVVQAAMKLSSLEEKSGHSYSEAVANFEAVNEKNRKLSQDNLNLQKQIEEKEEKRKEKLRENRTTEREVRYIIDVRQKLRKHGISLTDAEGLQKYLENMKETGGNPKRFLKYTRRYGSLQGRLTVLQKQKEDEAKALIGTQREKDSVKAEIGELQTILLTLRTEKSKATEELKGLKEEIGKDRTRLEAEVASLAKTLRVKSNVEEINKAIINKEEKLQNLEAAIVTKQNTLEGKNSEIQESESKIQELSQKKQGLEGEIEETLKIRSYVTELKAAVADLETQISSSKKQAEEMKERMALADTITNFLTRAPNYDFSRFYSMVESVKRIREDKSNSFSTSLPRTEENIRMLAIEAFHGDLVSKLQYGQVVKYKEEYKEGNIERDATIQELQSKLRAKEDELAIQKQETNTLGTIKVNFEGGQKTIAELRELTKTMFAEEIEKRATEKYNALAAGVTGIINWVDNKITKKHEP